MPETNPKSRAAYLRAYRARKAALAPPRPAPVCPQCHKEFTADRSDARYCSKLCRVYAWQAVVHRGIFHNPDGWIIPANTATLAADAAGHSDRYGCAKEIRTKDRVFCQRLATWLATDCHNGGGIYLHYLCDAHCSRAQRAAVCDPEAACHRTDGHRRKHCPAKSSTIPRSISAPSPASGAS